MNSLREKGRIHTIILPFSYHNAIYGIGWTIRKYLGL